MARLWVEGEPIAVRCDHSGRPLSFRWGRMTYTIARICNRWRAHDVWWEEDEVWCEYIKVATTDGVLCLITLDIKRNRWFLLRVYD